MGEMRKEGKNSNVLSLSSTLSHHRWYAPTTPVPTATSPRSTVDPRKAGDVHPMTQGDASDEADRAEHAVEIVCLGIAFW